MLVRFQNPAYLWLLLGIPFVIYFGLRLTTLSWSRRWVSIILRCIIILLFVLALGRVELVKKHDNLFVFFLMDHSKSIPQDLRFQQVGFINRAAEDMGKNDTAGVIVFGSDASIEIPDAKKLKITRIESVPGEEQTDISAAIRMAMARFPEDSQKRIVLLSDGNENKGDAVEQARVASGQDVYIDTIPIYTGIEKANEVYVDELMTPSTVKADEPFNVKIVVSSEREGAGRLSLYQNNKKVAEQEIKLDAGKNAFTLPRTLATSGFYKFEARVDVPGDALIENNRAFGFTVIKGEPKVLLVTADPIQEADLVAALRLENINVEMLGIGEIPSTLAEYQDYDSVILSNVDSVSLSPGIMKSLESNVKDSGAGLVMIGGEDSFGAGGYNNTPVEKALPVDMDVKHKKVLPRGALVLVLHTCEIPDGNAWARDIAIAALNTLSSRDLMGVLIYDYTKGESWLFPLRKVAEKAYMKSLINSATPGDMPSFDTTLQMAYNGLNSVMAGKKHIVIISDGDPASPNQFLANKIKKANITISTVGIAPHSPRDTNMLKVLAQWGGGNFYDVKNPNALPRIFIKEAMIVKRGLLQEEPFKPVVQHTSELIENIQSGFPVLKGYVVTTAKDKAETPLISDKKDPVLAHWRYGLGKSAAFTSDAKKRWAADWLAWGEYSKFWAGAVRWTMRSMARSDLKIASKIEGSKGTITIDAIDDKGDFINFLEMKGTVVSPEFNIQKVQLKQVGPGKYETGFTANEVGSYMVNVISKQRGAADDTAAIQTAGVALSYSPEFKSFKTNEPLLGEISSITRGRMLGSPEAVFDHNLLVTKTSKAVWWTMLAAAICLFPIDIFIRRVMIDYGKIFVWAKAAAARTPILRKMTKLRVFTPLKRPSYGIRPGRGGRWEEALRQEDSFEAGEVHDEARAFEGSSETAEAAEVDVKGKGAARAPSDSEYIQRLFAAKKRARRKKGLDAGRKDENKGER